MAAAHPPASGDSPGCPALQSAHSPSIPLPPSPILAASNSSKGTTSLTKEISPSLAPSNMAASRSGAGKDPMMGSDGKELVAAKIEEGIYKVREIRRLADDADHDIEVLQKEVDDMAAAMESELKLDEYCSDLSDMRKARQVYRAVELSEAEERSLCEINAGHLRRRFCST